MDGVAFGLGHRGIAARKRSRHETAAASGGNGAFAGDSDSDHESEGAVKERFVGHVAAGDISEAPALRPPVPAGASVDAPADDEERAKPRVMGSQIARLITRRRDIETHAGAEGAAGNEDAVYRFDMDRCPEPARLDDYSRVPIDGFGESMLRSMGWKGNVKKDAGDDGAPTPRYHRLGLGAKPPTLAGDENDAPPAKRPRTAPSAVAVAQVPSPVPGVAADGNEGHSSRFQGSVTSRDDRPPSAEAEGDSRNGHREGHHARGHGVVETGAREHREARRDESRRRDGGSRRRDDTRFGARYAEVNEGERYSERYGRRDSHRDRERGERRHREFFDDRDRDGRGDRSRQEYHRHSSGRERQNHADRAERHYRHSDASRDDHHRYRGQLER